MLDYDLADDYFSGAGGWDLAAEDLGITARGIENMPAARATREAAGLVTVHDDVWTYVPDGRAAGQITSPPCQTFSVSGHGAGRRALDNIHTIIDNMGYVDIDILRKWGDEMGDDRTALVLTPLHFAVTGNYRWLAWEQVPQVLPVWEACAEVLRDLGWSVWTGVLNAEQYGVPQTRKRAFLLASLDREVVPPVPTHSKYHSRHPERLDEGVLKWVSMAEALGWGATERPSMTVTGGGTETGGAEPFGSGARKSLERERDDGRWMASPSGVTGPCHRPMEQPAHTVTGAGNYYAYQESNYSGYAAEGPRPLGRRDMDEPSSTITSKGARWKLMSGTRRGAVTRHAEEPSVTLAFGHDAASFAIAPENLSVEDLPEAKIDGRAIRISVEEAAVIQTFPRDYPWQGRKGKQYLQVGNAVPPLLARAALSSVVPLTTVGGQA